jgi:Nitrile hydratase, alpha chain
VGRHGIGTERNSDRGSLPRFSVQLLLGPQSLLVEKGFVDRAALDALIDTSENKVGPRNGARVVAQAWSDPAYKQRLLTNPDAAIAELPC